MHDLCLIVPCFNEASRVATSANALFQYFNTPYWHDKSITVLFVNDGSLDTTEHALTELPQIAGNVSVTTYSYVDNRGKGAAIKHGAQLADAATYGFIDADLAFPLDTLENMYHLRTEADLIVGERTHILEPTIRARIRWVISRTLQSMLAVVLRLPVRDTQCGIKLFSKNIVTDIFPTIEKDRFAFDVELLVRAAQLKRKIITVPVTFRYHEGSSVRLRDGLRYIMDVWRITTHLRF